MGVYQFMNLLANVTKPLMPDRSTELMKLISYSSLFYCRSWPRSISTGNTRDNVSPLTYAAE